MPGSLKSPAPTGRRPAHAESADPRLLDAATISEVVEMALSDYVSFTHIRALHGLSPDQVKVLMRSHLRAGSYRAWRRRIEQFGTRRESYK